MYVCAREDILRFLFKSHASETSGVWRFFDFTAHANDIHRLKLLPLRMRKAALGRASRLADASEPENLAAFSMQGNMGARRK